jgi:hypothetical protein
MPARASHIPHNLERTTLQKMNATEGLLVRQLHPAGQGTLNRMLAKGWIEKQMDAKAGARYRITPAGEAALKAKIPDPPRRRRGTEMTENDRDARGACHGRRSRRAAFSEEVRGDSPDLFRHHMYRSWS